MLYIINRVKETSLSMRRMKIILYTVIMVCFIFPNTSIVSANVVTGGSMVNVRIDYIEEIAIVSAGTGGSIKYYMSTDNKSWELLEPSGIVDISTVLKTKETPIYFKGNRDTQPREVKLQGLDGSLKVTYLRENGEGKFVIAGNLPVEYRKGANGTWKTAPYQMSTSIYEVKGATLQFRYSATIDRRAGKVVNLKIPKKSTAPSVTVDGSKFELKGLRNGETQYRLGDSTVWIPFITGDGKAKTLDLRSLLAPTSVANTPLPAAVIEVRNVNDTKKTISSVKILEIEAQPVFPEYATLLGTTLKISDPDPKRAYEYTRVERNSVLNLNTAKWTTITSKKSVIIPKAAVGDKVYVRVKSTTSKDTKKITPASTYKAMDVVSITVK